MSKLSAKKIRFGLLLTALAVTVVACTALGKNEVFFGKVTPPTGQVMRYVSGSETESLDNQVGSGNNDIRIYMALSEGLVEYNEKDMSPDPAIAERWDTNADSSEFVFHLRENARWSNNEPITAQDFVYTFQRALSPELASRNAYLAYYIKYGQAYNSDSSFVRDPQTGKFLLAKDFAPPTAAATASGGIPAGEDLSLDTDFHHYIHEPDRLTLPNDKKEREAALAATPPLREAIKDKEFVPIKAENIGVEAINEHTLRVTLSQSAPFFVKLLPHTVFRAVPKKVVEQYKDAWATPGHMVSSGPFRLKLWKPYDKVVVERNPYYWDAANVHLDEIVFYPVQDAVTVMNMYKAGEIDAMANHQVPGSWLDKIRPLKDYMDAPEAGNEYYDFNTKKAPMDNKLVRKAFNMSINKVEYAQWRKIIRPLLTFVPGEIFPGYPAPKGDDFNPEKAKQLLAQAGYKDDKGNFDPKKFPANLVEITYNPEGSNQSIAEYLQAKWKQNLGITLPLKAMEWRSFVAARPKLEYKGVARDAWGADYMDPFTFLNLFYTGGENGCGWSSPKYDKMLDEANRMLDPQKRYELLAKAEAFLLDEQPIMPLATTATNWMKKPYVKGMYPNPGSLHAWKKVYIEPDQSKWDYAVPDMTNTAKSDK
ncbi:MAG TPA: peptide ABC transporter substrate-binding protein [Pyrinomonadaceae bacterium]|jgi:oligopeptide transport system substrate-binding protein|nr:peptide ABC transporter substrate-binding protein [Pyrinomonadaceae bacterium]